MMEMLSIWNIRINDGVHLTDILYKKYLNCVTYSQHIYFYCNNKIIFQRKIKWTRKYSAIFNYNTQLSKQLSTKQSVLPLILYNSILCFPKLQQLIKRAECSHNCSNFCSLSKTKYHLPISFAQTLDYPKLLIKSP